MDKQLHVIREKLEDEYESESIDFYETPDIAEKWRPKKISLDKSNYFWITSNPNIWTVDEIKDGSIVNYTAFNENGNKRKVFKAFEKTEPGDWVVFYESTPKLSIVAKGEVVEGLHKSVQEGYEDEVDVISFRHLEDLNPISWSEIIQHKVLKESSVVGKRAQGSLFELTEQEYNASARKPELQLINVYVKFLMEKKKGPVK